MSNDHFVSVTFLTRFCDENSIKQDRRKREIYVFDKTTNTFLVGKKKLIKQANKPDLDGTEQFVERPNFKTELKSSEDEWNNVYCNIIEDKHSTENHELLIKYIWQMLMNNPKRQRERENILICNATENEAKYIENLKTQESCGLKEIDYIHKQIRDISLFESGEINLTKEMLSLNYRFLKNDTDVPFVTSDSPFLYCIGNILIPISKCYVLQFDTAEYSLIKHVGTVCGVNQELIKITDSNDARHINRCTREAADKYVYAALKDAF